MIVSDSFPNARIRYNGPASGDDVAGDIAVDGIGHVFVTGYTYHSSSQDDDTTIAYSAAGETLWTTRYSTPFGGDSQPRTSHSLAMTTSNSIKVNPRRDHSDERGWPARGRPTRDEIAG